MGRLDLPDKPRDEDFVVKDSGKRESFDSGMVRDTTEGKIDYSLVLDGPMFKRVAVHLTKGALKYAKRNWMKARGQEELDRFRESALRHFIAWFMGETDEDHAAAVIFNINGAEYVKDQMPQPVTYVPVKQLKVTPPRLMNPNSAMFADWCREASRPWNLSRCE